MCPTKTLFSNDRKPHSEKLSMILKICQKMNSERNLPVLLDLIAREATKLMEADRASIFLLDRDKHELWSQVALDCEPIRIDASLGIAGACATTGQTINVEDAHQDPHFYSGIDARHGYRTTSVLAVPLRNYEGNITGVFEVLDKKSGVFTKNDEEILKALASQVAIAIEAVQFVQGLEWHQNQLLEENTRLWKEIDVRFSTQNIIGTSEKIQKNLMLIKEIRNSSINVLITGESGTGKELLAKAIHYNSPRARNRLVALNCAALPESLVESERFGIEKGVATGVEQRTGKVEIAKGGTLFLDEIGDLSLTAQAKILRVLQEGIIERVGSRKEIPVDVRILAATNKDLSAEISRGTFRDDLYYRMNVIDIHTPPLREIREDIPLLANYFLAKYCQEGKKKPQRLTPGVERCLMNYYWPGNVRELENQMKRLAVLVHREELAEEDLSEAILQSGTVVNAHSLKGTVAEVEKRLILETLQTCKQNQVQTAKALGLSRQGLSNKIKRYRIKSL